MLEDWSLNFASFVAGQGLSAGSGYTERSCCPSLEILQKSMLMQGQNLALRKLSAGSHQRGQSPHSLLNVEIK